MPTIGLFAFKVNIEAQRFCDNPAFAVVGISSTTIAIVEVEAAQGGFEIVHAKTFVPNPAPVTEVVGESEFVIVPLPEINVHTPIPTVGVFAAIVVVLDEIQSVWLLPAFAIVGTSSTTIAIVADEEAQGAFEIVHSKIFVPKAKPVIVVFGKVGFVMVPLPEINVHCPIPTVGVFAVIVVVLEEIQSVWLVPAFAIDGIFSTLIATVDEDGAQGELEIVH